MRQLNISRHLLVAGRSSDNQTHAGAQFQVITRWFGLVLLFGAVGCAAQGEWFRGYTMTDWERAVQAAARNLPPTSAMENNSVQFTPNTEPSNEPAELQQRLWSGVFAVIRLSKQASRPRPGATPAPARDSGGGPGTGGSDGVVPVLEYDEPANFYRGAATSPIEYSSREVNCSVQVYQFQPCSEDMRATFQQTMLRDRIDPRFREGQLAAAPAFSTLSVPGADAVLMARFQDNLDNQRVRLAVFAAGHVAILDVAAKNGYSWQKSAPSLKATLASLHVSTKAATPSMREGPGEAGRAFAGLYRGTKPKYVVNLLRPVGYGDHIVALHYYLFAPDGSVYRCYDFAPGPGGDWRRFDFADARRSDPVNTGRYTVRGDQLYIQMGSTPPERINSTLTNPNSLEIETVTYIREN